jgi:hypothetical protein
MSKKRKFSTVEAAESLLLSMEHAIHNMIEEVRKPVSPDLTGAARKAELSSIKQTVVDARELLQERQRIEDMIIALKDKGEIEDKTDYSSGFAEQFAK